MKARLLSVLMILLFMPFVAVVALLSPILYIVFNLSAVDLVESYVHIQMGLGKDVPNDNGTEYYDEMPTTWRHRK